jgi:hypothetical protein
MYNKPIANTMMNGRKMKTCSIKSGMRKGCLLALFLFNTEFEIVSTAKI